MSGSVSLQQTHLPHQCRLTSVPNDLYVGISQATRRLKDDRRKGLRV